MSREDWREDRRHRALAQAAANAATQNLLESPNGTPFVAVAGDPRHRIAVLTELDRTADITVNGARAATRKR